MTTKLTKVFAEFVGGRGFLIANEGEISQQPGEDYKLARQIFRNRTVLVKFMADLAVAVTAGIRLHKCQVENETDVHCLRNFLAGLEKTGYVVRWSNMGTLFSVQVPDDRKRLVFFRSGWAEQCFRSAICTTVSEFCKAHKPSLSFKMFQNVKLARKGESALFTELDLVVQIERRFYLFEIKSGPWVRILQWARREEAFVTEGGPARQIVCTIHDNIPANIFEPQILMTIGGIQKRLKRLLSADFTVAID